MRHSGTRIPLFLCRKKTASVSSPRQQRFHQLPYGFLATDGEFFQDRFRILKIIIYICSHTADVKPFIPQMIISSSRKEKEQYFRRMFEEFYPPFCLYAKRFIDNKEVREDIVSEVFAKVWEKIDANELTMDTAVAYIKVSVRNLCLNHLQHQMHEWNYTEWRLQAHTPAYATSPDKIYTLDELYTLLYETLGKLPQHHRQVFLKSFIENKTHAEIARDMDISIKSVNRYKQKVMAMLREELKDFLPVILLLLSGRLGR